MFPQAISFGTDGINFNKGVTSGTRTAYLSGTPEFTSGLSGVSVTRSLVYLYVL
jgi:hypothetical protein